MFHCILLLSTRFQLENGNVSAPEALADVSSNIKDLDDLFIGDLLEVQNILHKIVNLVDETVNSSISENSTNVRTCTKLF